MTPSLDNVKQEIISSKLTISHYIYLLNTKCNLTFALFQVSTPEEQTHRPGEEKMDSGVIVKPQAALRVKMNTCQ